MSESVWSWDIDRFLNESASSSPTPGGGSISAYAGALGASMVCMVANLTIGKEKYKAVEAEVAEILGQAEICLEGLKSGLTKDINVFNKFMDVLKMPKETDGQKVTREQRMQEVLREATDSPVEVARKSFMVLQLAQKLAPIGNKGAISDVGVAAYLAESAINSALLSVDINLPQIKDISYAAEIQKECQSMKTSAADILKDTVRIVKERLV
ncbi:MAG: Methenyltetrahydrofolate cyclohydrolase [Candidatus Dichloromethanomonas elyunquensis]|nr:MAG: Methenyltetrahydrofolate cyclohydrolase [Candidatus Dichloromethanomonas elyunquensis]